MKELETKRLILRKVKLSDVDDLFNNWSSDCNTTKYLSFDTHDDRAQTEKLVNKMLEKQNKGRLEWVIELKDNQQVIGIISAKDSYKYKCLELGYSLCSKYWNKGLATEALSEVLDYIFSECDIDVIEAIIPDENIGSIVVAQKCGLLLEARLKNRYKDKNNIVQDMLIYSKWKNEFNKVYQFDINDRAFNAIRDNKKRVEIRTTKLDKDSFDYSILKCNDEIIFSNSINKRIKCLIEEVNWYNSIEELLTLEGTRYTLSSTNDYDEGIKSINSLDGYLEAINKNGVYAIHIKFIEDLF